MLSNTTRSRCRIHAHVHKIRSRVCTYIGSCLKYELRQKLDAFTYVKDDNRLIVDGIILLDGIKKTFEPQLVTLIWSMSPWVLPEGTLGTVGYIRKYPRYYRVYCKVPCLCHAVPRVEVNHVLTDQL
jgi:hypothetical protein